jgi:hypothetical protein
MAVVMSTSTVTPSKMNNYFDGNDKQENGKQEAPASRTVLQLTWDAVLKAGDQMSPLLLKDANVFVAASVIFVIFVAWGVSLIYNLSEMYLNCNEDNGCVTCSVTLEATEGAECSPLAATSLDIKAGCMSTSIPNQFAVVKDVVDTISANVKNHWKLPARFKASVLAHSGIAGALRENEEGQMIDPDPEKVRTLMLRHWFGLSGTYTAGSGEDTIKGLSDATLKSIGLKILYSYISTGCAIFSHYTQHGQGQGHTGVPDDLPMRYLHAQNYEMDDSTGIYTRVEDGDTCIEYIMLDPHASNLLCPRTTYGPDPERDPKRTSCSPMESDPGGPPGMDGWDGGPNCPGSLTPEVDCGPPPGMEDTGDMTREQQQGLQSDCPPENIKANADAAIEVPDLGKHGQGIVTLAIPTTYVQSAVWPNSMKQDALWTHDGTETGSEDIGTEEPQAIPSDVSAHLHHPAKYHNNTVDTQPSF